MPKKVVPCKENWTSSISNSLWRYYFELSTERGLFFFNSEYKTQLSVCIPALKLWMFEDWAQAQSLFQQIFNACGSSIISSQIRSKQVQTMVTKVSPSPRSNNKVVFYVTRRKRFWFCPIQWNLPWFAPPHFPLNTIQKINFCSQVFD